MSARSVHSASTSRPAGSSMNESACAAVAVRRSSTTTSGRLASGSRRRSNSRGCVVDRVGAPYHDDVRAIADLAERGRARSPRLEGEPGRAVEQRAGGIDHRAERLGQRHRGALRLAGRLAQPVHERRACAREDRGRLVEGSLQFGLATVDAGVRRRGIDALGEPRVAERTRADQALEPAIVADDRRDVVAHQAAAAAGRGALMRRHRHPLRGAPGAARPRAPPARPARSAASVPSQ